MANTDLISRVQAQEILRPDFSIRSNVSYDRKSFVRHAKHLFDLQKYSNQLRENTNNFDALYDLMNILRQYVPGDEETNIETWKHDPHEALKQANDLESQGSFGMGKFVERNRESLLDKLSAEQLYSLFQNVPIYEGNKPKHKKIKTLREKVYAMQKAEKEGQNPSAVVGRRCKQII